MKTIREIGYAKKDAKGKVVGLLGTAQDVTEHKRAEEDLRKNEEKYRKIFENVQDVFYQTDTNGLITEISPSIKRYSGYRREELIGKLVEDVYDHREDRANLLKIISEKGEVIDYELRLKTKTGSLVYVSVNAHLLINADGKPEGVAGSLRDITERKQAEAAMRESEEKFRQLAENINEVFWITDATMHEMFYVSPAYEKIWGLSCESLYASPRQWLEVIHPEDREVILKAVADFATSRIYDAEYRIIRPDRTVRWIHDRGFPVRNANGVIYRIAGTAEDITERKRAEESQSRLATAVEQSAESILITDTRGAILYVNPAFEKTSGYTRAEALGQNPRMLKSGKHDAEFYHRMWQVLGQGQIWSGHLTNRRKDGTLYEEEATISPVRDSTGKVVNYVAVKRDTTREMQLESQIRHVQKMEAIGTLAGGVAHDFNNILSVIEMEASLLKSDGDLSAEQTKLADDISFAVQRAVALTRQLLMFSRKQTMQPRDLDLNESVKEVTNMLRRIIGEHIEMQVKLAAQPMLIHADAGMLDQVLMNLSVNARDAMPDGGRLVIETSHAEIDELIASQSALARPGSFVCLSVSDSGCGIPPENLQKIFEPFFTTKAVGKGTGLGLATVFGIVQQHKGWINVHSQVGRGTLFKVYLPRLAEKHDTKFIQKMPATRSTGNETILMVDDEITLRVVVGRILTHLGYRVLEASTGVKALEVWKEHRDEIGLLLTDLMMPDGMTGIELAQRLLQENPKLKVVYMSGYGTSIVGKDFPLEEGVNFLAKPFQSVKLAQTVRNCLDKH